MPVSIKIEEVLSKIEFVKFIGERDDVINKIVPINKSNVESNVLSWCSDKNEGQLADIKTGTIVISNKVSEKHFNTGCNYIIVEKPRRIFQQILSLFFVEKSEPKISKTAIIEDTVILGENIFIGQNVVIEKNCKIGDNTIIQHNTTIFKDTIVGKNVVIGANNTIGGIGFGYEKDEEGNFQLIPHIGNVIIENNVEIGNNTTIDRAVLGSTLIAENVKIDNLVHIAHGVQIGRNSVVIANSMVAGSVTIGENSWIAPSSSILNQRSVGDNSLVGMGAVVLKNVGDNEVVAGNPSKLLKKL